MPATSQTSEDHPWRQSWPPVQLYLQQEGSSSGHVQQQDATSAAQTPRENMTVKLDDSPMSYFLAPPRPLLAYDDDDDTIDEDDVSSYHTDLSDIDLDMDAGIEDVGHPRPTVRAVSPSSLDRYRASGSPMRLRRRTASLLRPPTPPRQSTKAGQGEEDLDLDDNNDDDGDDYVRFGMAVPVSISVPVQTSSTAAHTMPHGSGPTGASSAPAARHQLPTVGRPVRRRSPRSWRVPSPTVFSIEEEVEQDEEQQCSNLPARKQVRFVLPYGGS